MLQRHNRTTRPPHGGLTVALRWPWGGIRFLACLGCLEIHTAASRRPCGGLTLPSRRPCGKLVVAATAVWVPYGHRTVAYRSPCSFYFMNPCGVAITFVTTTTVACKQGWVQIRFFKYKYKYMFSDFSKTNTNTNTLKKISNTNTNTNTNIQIQIQIQIR